MTVYCLSCNSFNCCTLKLCSFFAETARKPPGASNHKLVPVMPEGSILTDLMKKQWKLGKPVGSGGFGMIYLSRLNVNALSLLQYSFFMFYYLL